MKHTTYEKKMILFLVKAEGDCFKPKFRTGRLQLLQTGQDFNGHVK